MDLGRPIKLVRHYDKRWNVYELHRQGQLDYYQGYQSKPIFECEFVVSFLGMPRRRARLHGVYRVGRRHDAGTYPTPPDLAYPDWAGPDRLFYELTPVPGFEDVLGRVVITWGGSPLAWHQWYTDREVTEVLPRGYVRSFPGYLDFVLSHAELRDIVAYPDANHDWHRMLGAIAGVYLILDTVTGRQYVGSAAGAGGIMRRWTDYAESGHGGNHRLKELLTADPLGAARLQFTLLQTLPPSLTRDEVIAYETLHKHKLGSRAFGLNAN